MPHETVTLFFALLTLALGLGLAAFGLAILTGRAPALVATVHSSAVEMAAGIAVAATLGSLYLSEVVGYTPCRLCWVQRGFMYPAAALLVVGLVTGRRLFVTVAGVLAVVGLPIALFHRYEQAAGGFESLCDAAVPCASRWVNHLGFVTIPTMAAVAFAAIAILVLTSHRRSTS